MNTEYYYWDFEHSGEDGSTVIQELSSLTPGTLVTTAEAAELWIPGYDGNGTALSPEKINELYLHYTEER